MDSTFNGEMEIAHDYNPNDPFASRQIVNGIFSGADFRFQDDDDPPRYFWGSMQDGKLTGWVAWDCYYDCGHWGIFELTRP
jgi:hypothetical protein